MLVGYVLLGPILFDPVVSGLNRLGGKTELSLLLRAYLAQMSWRRCITSSLAVAAPTDTVSRGPALAS